MWVWVGSRPGLLGIFAQIHLHMHLGLLHSLSGVTPRSLVVKKDLTMLLYFSCLYSALINYSHLVVGVLTFGVFGLWGSVGVPPQVPSVM